MAIVIAQAFGLIWYAAQLDSTVSTLSVTVSELKASMTDTSIAVIENDLAYLKEKVTALGTPVEFDDGDLWYTIEQLEIPDFTDADAQELYTKIDKIETVQTDLQNNLSVIETTVNYLQDRLDDIEVKAEANELMEVNAYLELRAELVAYLDSIEAELQELAISVAVIEAVMESDFNKTLKNGGLSKVYNELKLDAESPEVLP